jgi:3-oxoacid CoA-transferase subunit A/3-oxoadipate CoA-transferase alpha subunit
MVGGFGLVGTPLTLLAAVARNADARDLTVIANNVGEPGLGLGALMRAGALRRVIGSYFTSNPEVVQAHYDGTLEVQVLPQGTLAEAIRAGGAGIGAFYTPTAVGTLLVADAEQREIGGRMHVLQAALRADVSLVCARAADTLGNLVYERTARNFNPEMATAGATVIAEVDEIVEVGDLRPEEITTPHNMVDHVVRAEPRL